MKQKKYSMGIDYFDLVKTEYNHNKQTFGEQKIRELIISLKKAKINTIYWRISYIGIVIPISEVATNPIDILERYDHSNIPEHLITRMLQVQKVYKECNPLEVAIDQCKKLNIDIFAYITIYDDCYEGFEQEFGKKHPEYYSRHYSGNGYVKGVMSLGYPQVKEYKLKLIKELLKYNVDGIYLDIARTHSGGNPIPVHGWYPQWTQPYLAYGYNDYEVKRYKDLYGENPPVIDIINNKDINIETEAEKNWNRVRGSFVDEFIKESSDIVKSSKKILSVAFYPRTYNGFQPGYYTRQMIGRINFDWEKWIDNKWIDELHLIAGHRRFGYDDWIKHSGETYKKAQDKGVKVLTHGCIVGKIDELENCPYKLPVSDRKRYLELQEKYVWKMLNTSADGIYFYEAIYENFDLYKVLGDVYEKYENS